MARAKEISFEKGGRQEKPSEYNKNKKNKSTLYDNALICMWNKEIVQFFNTMWKKEEGTQKRETVSRAVQLKLNGSGKRDS